MKDHGLAYTLAYTYNARPYNTTATTHTPREPLLRPPKTRCRTLMSSVNRINAKPITEEPGVYKCHFITRRRKKEEEFLLPSFIRHFAN